MLRELFKNVTPVLYVQIWKDRIKATNITTGKIYNEPSLLAIKRNPQGQNVISAIGNNAKKITANANTTVINPFSHPRVVINDFSIAEKMLQYIVNILVDKRWLVPTSKMIIHPMEEYEGGITLLEHQAFIEIAIGAGAKEATVYIGSEIPISRLDFEKIKEESTKNLPSYVSFKAQKESHRSSTNILIIAAIVVGSILWLTSIQQ